MKAQPILPPDVAAYLVAAATEMASEQGFTPNSERDLATWMEGNATTIGARAQAAMDNLRVKLLSDQRLMDAACEVLSKRVYDAIPKTAARQWNPRFLRYAQSRGMSPESVLKADGNMTNYLCWRGN